MAISLPGVTTTYRKNTSGVPQNAVQMEQTPTMSAKEVQDTVNKNAGGQAPNLAVNGVGQLMNGTSGYGANKPFYSVYAQPMEQTLNDLLNPKPFNYDVNADGLYQQIKDNYTKAGRQAMMDTQGQSAALTGGYGNSYGASAGQQAYQESLGNLSGMIPQLQQMAYQQYLQQQDDKRNNLEAMNKLDSQDFARWMDNRELQLKLLELMPQLALANGTTEGGGGGGTINGMLDHQVAHEMNKVLRNEYGSNNAPVYNIDQLLALEGLTPEQQKMVSDVYSSGATLNGLDTNTGNYWNTKVYGGRNVSNDSTTASQHNAIMDRYNNNNKIKSGVK